ncbi:MAG TPA: TadE/TadG family type IV pilus assembly protein [Candidatus Cybelea sp.]
MRPRNGERGSTLAETALVMGVLLLLTLGIMDFARALYTYSFVANAARQGARWAIVRGSQCTQLDHCNAKSSDVQTYVQSLSEGAMKASNITANLGFPACSGSNAPGCVAEVTVQYPFTFVAPFVSKLTLTMSSTSEMLISN